MTDYIILMFAVVLFTAQFSFTKLYEGELGQNLNSALIMLVVTSSVGALLFLATGGFSVEITEISIIYAVALAFIMIPYYLIGIKVLSLGSLAIYSMFMMLGGMLVPFFYGILLLGEDKDVTKTIGVILLTAFIVLQAVSQKTPDSQKVKKNGSCLFFILCLLSFFINGMTGVIAKAHTISEGAVDEASFTVLYCTLTAVISLSLLFIVPDKGRVKKNESLKSAFKPKPIIIMASLGASCYGGNFLQLLAADKVPASVQFPLVSGGVIVLSAIASAFVFKEKLSKTEWISILGAFASTFLFAF